MQANPKFTNRDSSFWAYVKLISEQVGYSKGGILKKYGKEEVVKKLSSLKINTNTCIIEEVLEYLNYRADILNHNSSYFMNVEEAREQFKRAKELHDKYGFTCSLPLNKQKNEKKDYAYFTCIINTMTEGIIRKFADENGLIYGVNIGFNDDPRTLTYFKDSNNQLDGILSRRFDGAFPATINPAAIWEIKEYYYTTTFGSRIADGVYETQLDGFELKTIHEETHNDVKHFYLIDDYNTWWKMGKSYLCRIVDMLHIGLVDEVIFGKEVFDRWIPIMEDLLYKTYIK